jgi:hypothetical protein
MTQSIDDCLVSSDITAIGAKGFHGSSHEYIDLCRVHFKEIAYTPSAGTNGSDGIRLIDIQIEFLLLFES